MLAFFVLLENVTKKTVVDDNLGNVFDYIFGKRF